MGDWFYIFETFNLNFYFLAPRLARTLLDPGLSVASIVDWADLVHEIPGARLYD